MSDFIQENFLRKCGVEVILQLGLGIIMSNDGSATVSFEREEA